MTRVVPLAALCLAALPALAQEPDLADPAPAAVTDPAAETGLPLWEVGLFGFGLRGPDYPASSEQSLNGLVVPFAVYRGELLRVDEEGDARLVPIDRPAYEVSFSAAAAFGADSSDNEAREGMPDLDPLIELGAQFVLRGPELAGGEIDAALEARVVSSLDTSDLGLTYRGILVEPELRYERGGLFGGRGRLRLTASASFATEPLHGYYYDVAERFARADRPAFEASGGYLGSRFRVGFGYDVTDRVQLITGAGVRFHAGAANEDSPLFEDEITTSLFAGLAWTFVESTRRVSRPR